MTYSWGLTSAGIFAALLAPVTAHAIDVDEGDNVSLVSFTHLNEPQSAQAISVVSNYPVYTSSVGARYRISLDLRYRVITGWQGSTPMNILVKVIETPFPGQEIVVPPGASPTAYTTLSETSFAYTGHIGNAISPIANEITVNIPEFVIAEGVSFMLAFYFELESGQVGTRHMEVFRCNLSINTAPTLVVDTLYYKLEKALPLMKGSDLIKSMMQNFNGIIETKNGEVNIYNRDEWYQDEGAEDWTFKIDHLQDIVHTPISDINKRQLFQYLEDDKDSNQASWRQFEPLEYGALQVDLNDDLLYGENLMTSDVRFAPSMPEVALGANIPTGYVSGETADTFANNYNIEDRILLNKGAKGMSYQLQGAAPTLDLTEYVDTSFEELKFENLFPQFFQRTFDLLNFGEFIECYVLLTPTDYLTLDYRKPKLLRLSDGNIVKAWINRISDLRPHSNTHTKIEFISFKNRGTEPRVGGSGAYSGGYSIAYDNGRT
jgi:hypothetical protein